LHEGEGGKSEICREKKKPISFSCRRARQEQGAGRKRGGEPSGAEGRGPKSSVRRKGDLIEENCRRSRRRGQVGQKNPLLVKKDKSAEEVSGRAAKARSGKKKKKAILSPAGRKGDSTCERK